MPRGGKRVGAGRPHGSRERKTIEEEAASANESPRGFLLRLMRNPETRPDRRVRIAAALIQAERSAAPGAGPTPARRRRPG